MLNMLRGLLGAEEPPTTVVEARSEHYVSRPIHYREESILLYGPNSKPNPRNLREKYFEIVLHRPFTDSLFSLFRSSSQEEAEDRFITFKDRIPSFVQLTKDCTLPSLQRLCDALTAHRAWSKAHLAAHFRLADLFNYPEVQQQLDEVDVNTGATPVMVAIETGDLRLVQNLVSLKCSLDVSDLEGNNVYHYAARTSKDIIQVLAASGARVGLNTYNKAGYTPLHVACLADLPDCVRALLLAGADVNLSARPSTLLSPTTSQPSNTPSYVTDFLQEGTGMLFQQQKLFQQDMKHGGTPLHWALSKEIVEVLIDKNCSIDAVNFDGRTALHMMVLRDRLDCAVALMARGADASRADSDGNTALHLAVTREKQNLTMVQALLVFGADVDARNKEGATARHLVRAEMNSSVADRILYALHAVGAKRCGPERGGCPHSCSAAGQYAGVPPPAPRRPPARDAVQQMLAVAGMERAAQLDPAHKTGRLLCLDGGGIRGLVLVQVLLGLERMVGKPIVHCFDWVAGTSTGGILALALASGKSLRECQQLYFRLKDQAFAGMRPYPSEVLETILKETLGTETVMADIERPKVMVLAVLADRKPVDLHIFRNFQSAKEILDELNGVQNYAASKCGDAGDVCSLPLPLRPAEQRVWEAARASGAAPSYFRAFGRYLDGGLIGNNPTLDVLTELAELRLALRASGRTDEASAADLKIVVSAGTGLIPVTPLKDVDVFKPDSIMAAARLAWGLSAIGTLLVDQATMADGRVVDRARAWCSLAGVPYYRFNPPISKDVNMDERDDAVLVAMLWESMAFMHQQQDSVREVCAFLQ